MTTVYRVLGQHRRVTFHASSELEELDIKRHLGQKVRVLIRRNETLLATAAEVTSAPREARIVFVGRLVPHKGLALLLEALSQVAEPLRLDVYGAEEDAAYVERCKVLAANLSHEIAFHGSTEHEQILNAVRSSTLLALPTAGENFGHVIVEALSVGCPIVVADTTPWSTRIRTHGAGIVVDDSLAESWASAIRTVTTLSREDQNAMRQRAAQSFDFWQGEAGAHLLQMLE
ncbi:glycosyltransferase [Frigoribacterium sp. VKM Ac-2530]|uniref:glycosyltransferase n=1 Tax=Frigoribacterium sp. VKM Ac-2530 TaxID=2783822 RepID=UPI00188A3266|nr:glycosyltransferase [Frigoribacterium sp. VKM Ac-2530]MBF4578675.1 glycosyltransferase [Frigoribacterium sp. VKM Ac-2530]